MRHCPRLKRTRPAHAVEWELTNGLVPEGKELDHLCEQRDCIEPTHLEPVTHLVNVRRSKGKRR